MVVANHLLDPAVQARAQDVRVLGAFSVLDPARLDAAARAAFAALPAHPALPTLEALGPTLAEPHPDWMTRIAADWAARLAR
jgi:putative thiamine transport system substrate-binding protein